jgi:hypothetical protein
VSCEVDRSPCSARSPGSRPEPRSLRPGVTRDILQRPLENDLNTGLRPGRDLAADPVLRRAGGLRASTSPCAPELPPGCGLIGAAGRLRGERVVARRSLGRDRSGYSNRASGRRVRVGGGQRRRSLGSLTWTGDRLARDDQSKGAVPEMRAPRAFIRLAAGASSRQFVRDGGSTAVDRHRGHRAQGELNGLSGEVRSHGEMDRPSMEAPERATSGRSGREGWPGGTAPLCPAPSAGSESGTSRRVRFASPRASRRRPEDEHAPRAARQQIREAAGRGHRLSSTTCFMRS